MFFPAKERYPSVLEDDGDFFSTTVSPHRLWNDGQPVAVSGEHVCSDFLEPAGFCGSDEEIHDEADSSRDRFQSLFDEPEWA